MTDRPGLYFEGTDGGSKTIKAETVTVPKDTFTDLVDGILGMRSAIEDMNHQIAGLRKEVERVSLGDPFRGVLRTGHVPTPAPIAMHSAGGASGGAPASPYHVIRVLARDLYKDGKAGVPDMYKGLKIKSVVSYDVGADAYQLEVE